jgi:hypothetical protein
MISPWSVIIADANGSVDFLDPHPDVALRQESDLLVS